LPKNYIEKLENGVTLLGEELDAVSSAAISILIPSGAATDPKGLEGSANVLTEMLHRGAGPYDNEALSAEFEALGTQASHSAGIETTSISTTLLGENLPRAIELLSATILEPLLPEDELENCTQLAFQELKSLEDEPSSKVMVELISDFYPSPFGRCQLGTVEGITNLKIDSLRSYYKEQYVPTGVIIGVAGKFNWSEIKEKISQQLGGWNGKKELLTPGPLSKESSVRHIYKDTSQLQIALAYPSVAAEHPDYYAARVAVNVLSGGMAGRLFIEVREKRGLVYRVSASHSAAKGRAAVFCYAGTTTERAEETLQVMVQELRKLAQGVSEEELQRSKADLKSKIIMSSESSSARAGGLVSDYWSLGRIRSLSEIKERIDAVTSKDIERHLAEYPVNPMTLVTLGQKGLELPK